MRVVVERPFYEASSMRVLPHAIATGNIQIGANGYRIMSSTVSHAPAALNAGYRIGSRANISPSAPVQRPGTHGDQR
jgi:hypothetical protein